MRYIARRLTCVILLIAVVMAAGCDRLTDPYLNSADKVMQALIDCDSDELEDLGNFSDESLDLIDELSENELIMAVMDKAQYEIDKESLAKEDDVKSCEVEVKLPDYGKAMEDSDGDEDKFISAVKKQKSKDYVSLDLTLKFKRMDGQYILSNANAVVDKLYSSVNFEVTGETGNKYAIIYQDSELVLRLLKISSDGIHFGVQNQTGKKLRFDPRSIAINGRSVNDIEVNDIVEPDSTGQIFAKCEMFPVDKAAVMSGFMRIYSADIGDSYSFYINFADVTINKDAEYEKPVLEGKSLYEDDSIRVAFNEVREDKVILNVENLTNDNLKLSPDSIGVNGWSTSNAKWGDYEYISPKSIGEVDIDYVISADTPIGRVGGQFTVYRYDEAKGQDTLLETITYYGTIDDSVKSKHVDRAAYIYSDGTLIVYFKECTSEGVVLNVENTTDYSRCFYVKCLAINGKSDNDILCVTDIAPHCFGEVIVESDHDPSEPVGSISGNCGSNYKCGEDRGSDYFDIPYTVIDDSVVIEPQVPEGPLLYEDEKVKIYYKGINDKGVIFEVENLSDITLAMQSDLLVVNGNEYTDSEIIMSDSIAPHSTGIATSNITGFQETEVKSFSGTMKVVDIRVFDSYQVKLATVEFTE